jgi:hypothetical protein
MEVTSHALATTQSLSLDPAIGPPSPALPGWHETSFDKYDGRLCEWSRRPMARSPAPSRAGRLRSPPICQERFATGSRSWLGDLELTMNDPIAKALDDLFAKLDDPPSANTSSARYRTAVRRARKPSTVHSRSTKRTHTDSSVRTVHSMSA